MNTEQKHVISWVSPWSLMGSVFFLSLVANTLVSVGVLLFSSPPRGIGIVDVCGGVVAVSLGQSLLCGILAVLYNSYAKKLGGITIGLSSPESMTPGTAAVPGPQAQQPPPTTDQWFYQDAAGSEVGPLSLGDVCNAVREGAVTTQTQVTRRLVEADSDRVSRERTDSANGFTELDGHLFSQRQTTGTDGE